MVNTTKKFTHKDCIHYQEGFCNLNGIQVNPEGNVCPGFEPKNMQKVGDVTYSTQAIFNSSLQTINSNRNIGYGPGRKRRKRHGRRRI